MSSSKLESIPPQTEADSSSLQDEPTEGALLSGADEQASGQGDSSADEPGDGGSTSTAAAAAAADASNPSANAGESSLDALEAWRNAVGFGEETLMTRASSSSLEQDAVRPRRVQVHLERGTTVGRYVVLDELGTGAMGAVYRAYDPELDRSVALKVVDSSATPDASARLVREAKSLAQLSHPNVVAVHDVGSYNDDVFIAMGLVEGQTLREWRIESTPPPSIAEVVKVFAAAGRGLAAAHRAGIIHRDFKPDNVLLGNDGRVQVVDFGIARSPGGEGDSSDSWGDSAVWERLSHKEIEDSTVSGKLSAALTHAGAMLGTPAYMSPEQFRAEPADAKSDQFGFCIALYEALYGQRPFAGRAVVELRANILAGNIQPAPSESRVPSRLRRIVERGLRVPPEERYPSMDELIADLERDPSAQVKRIGFAVGVAALVAMLLFTIFRPAAASTLCKSANKNLKGVWDPARRAAAAKAFAASGQPFAAATLERVSDELDRYSRDWVTMRTETCEATHIAGTQSESLLDLRMTCLDERLGALSALVDVFAREVDAETVEKALPATLELPELDRCADTRALTAAIPPPDDPKARARVKKLRRRLADARALETTGRYGDALAVVEEITGGATSLGYSPLQAEVSLRGGFLQYQSGVFDDAEVRLREAVVHGARAKDDALVAEAWILLVQNASEQARYDDALSFELSARAAVLRAGESAREKGLFENALGGVRYAKGEFDEAFEHKRRALEHLAEALGDEHPAVAEALNALGNIYYARGRYAEARDYWEQGLAIREKALGPEHPLVARSVYNLGIVSYSQANYNRSETMFRRALALLRRAYGEEHPDTAAGYHAVGNLMLELGRYDEAEGPLRRSLTLREQVLGADHPLTGSSLHTLGQVLNLAERADEAEPLVTRAIEIWRAKLGPKHPKLGGGYLALGDAFLGRGQRQEALAHYEQALELLRGAFGEEHDHVALAYSHRGKALLDGGRFAEAEASYRKALAVAEAVLPEEHPQLAVSLSGLGECYLEMGRQSDALDALERALALRDKYPGGNRFSRAETEFALARALADQPAQVERATSLAERARTTFDGDKRPSSVAFVARVDRWRREHGQAVAAP